MSTTVLADLEKKKQDLVSKSTALSALHVKFDKQSADMSALGRKYALLEKEHVELLARETLSNASNAEMSAAAAVVSSSEAT